MQDVSLRARVIDRARLPTKLARSLGRMLPSAFVSGRRRSEVRVFRGSIAWPEVPPVYASYLALRPCPQDSEPVWFACPSPYDSFIRYILPVWCLASCYPKAIATAIGDSVLRTGLALRHVTPGRVLQSTRKLLQGNLTKESSCMISGAGERLQGYRGLTC